MVECLVNFKNLFVAVPSNFLTLAIHNVEMRMIVPLANHEQQVPCVCSVRTMRIYANRIN